MPVKNHNDVFIFSILVFPDATLKVLDLATYSGQAGLGLVLGFPFWMRFRMLSASSFNAPRSICSTMFYRAPCWRHELDILRDHIEKLLLPCCFQYYFEYAGS